jgi:folate-binding protein YgfZ
MTIISNLSHRGLLQVSGEGAKKFLQGQLTCNLDELNPGQSMLGAHCNPQGRIISFFRLFLTNDYFLSMPKELIPIAQQALQKYAVFFKVKLEEVSSTIPKDIEESTKLHKTLDITRGIPAIYPETSEKFLPHELNLPQINAVSFNKGCYTGQEIIARMHYRGKSKTRLYRARVSTELTLQRGNDIYVDSDSIGTLVDYCELEKNSYDLLFIAPENPTSDTIFFIDPEKRNSLVCYPFEPL